MTSIRLGETEIELMQPDAVRPRVDVICKSDDHLVALAGHPIADANLTNLFGAPMLPAGHERVMYILVSPVETLRDDPE